MGVAQFIKALAARIKIRHVDCQSHRANEVHESNVLLTPTVSAYLQSGVSRDSMTNTTYKRKHLAHGLLIVSEH